MTYFRIFSDIEIRWGHIICVFYYFYSVVLNFFFKAPVSPTMLKIEYSIQFGLAFHNNRRYPIVITFKPNMTRIIYYLPLVSITRYSRSIYLIFISRTHVYRRVNQFILVYRQCQSHNIASYKGRIV